MLPYLCSFSQITTNSSRFSHRFFLSPSVYTQQANTHAMPTNNDALLGKIFEMVQAKEEAKPKKKRKAMTPEQRERCLANLRKGRETSMRKRKEKAAAKKVGVGGAAQQPTPETRTRAAVKPTPTPPSPPPVKAAPAPAPPTTPPPPDKKSPPLPSAPESPPPRAPTPPPKEPLPAIAPVRLSTFGGGDSLW